MLQCISAFPNVRDTIQSLLKALCAIFLTTLTRFSWIGSLIFDGVLLQDMVETLEELYSYAMRDGHQLLVCFAPLFQCRICCF
jgi:hypothetical protein